VDGGEVRLPLLEDGPKVNAFRVDRCKLRLESARLPFEPTADLPREAGLVLELLEAVPRDGTRACRGGCGFLAAF
jgi:hypothetical protein